MTGQFASLLKGAGVRVDEQWNKYDGRRFYREEMECKIKELITINKNRSLFSFIFSLFSQMKNKYILILVLALIAL